MEGRTPFCFLAAARSRHRISGDRIIGKGRLPTSNRVTVALKLAASNLRTSQSYLGAQFRRLRARLDTPVAIKAMAAKGDRRRPRMDGRAILRPHSTCEVGNRRASGKERPRYPLEGRGNKRTNLSKGNIVEAQTSVAMSTQIDRPTALATMDLEQGGESRLRNPLREICTVGSASGETSVKPWWP
jgi:hypothetical protein